MTLLTSNNFKRFYSAPAFCNIILNFLYKYSLQILQWSIFSMHQVYFYWQYLKYSRLFYKWDLFKLGLWPSFICFICFKESSLKMMKSAFYFILTALFVLKIFKFWSWFFWSCRKNDLIRKIRLISTFMTSRSS